MGAGTKETSAVKQYAQLIRLSRQAAINDDLKAITVTAEAAGRTCNRLVGDLAFAVPTGNPTVADSIQFLHSSHGNVGTGGVPSATTSSEFRKLISAQVGPSNAALNIRPEIVIGPTALEDALCGLRDATNANETDDPLTPGYRAGRFSVVTDQRLDAASTTAYHACAAPRRHDGIQVVTMEGSRRLPLLGQMTQWVSDCIEWRILFDVVVLPVDFRTWCYNAGS